MFYISEIMTTAPDEYKNHLQQETYKALAQLKIPFERVDTDEAITMDDCILIDQKLNMKMVKTLFLCNRKKRFSIYSLLRVKKTSTLKILVMPWEFPEYLLLPRN